MRGSIFCRNGQRILAASYFLEKAPSQMFDSFLNVFLNSTVILLYYQYYYSFSFIYFIISIPCFIILSLIALSELFCYHLASFLMLGYFAAYFGQFLTFYQVFYLTLLKDIALFKVSLYTYFKARPNECYNLAC